MRDREGAVAHVGRWLCAASLLLAVGCTPTAEVPVPATEGAPATATEGAAAPTPDPAEDVGTFEVTGIADGDTLSAIGTAGRHEGQQVRIRLAIVDTAEVGQCGAAEAAAFVRAWLDDVDSQVVLRRPVDAPQRDPYDRVLGEVLDPARHSLNVALVDAGLARIDDRYGSEDPGLLRRLRDARDGAPPPACPDLESPQGLLGADDDDDPPATYSGCDEVRAAGVAPLLLGEPGYDPSMDGDGDGIACE